MKSLGTRLRETREAEGLTQEDVAKMLKVSRVSITNIENDARKVTAEELAKFAKIYSCTMEELMEGKKQKEKTLVFARSFEELSKEDQAEILDLIKFKKMQAKKKGKK